MTNPFSMLLTWLRWGGPTRNVGAQSPMPSSYPSDSASPVSFDTALELSAVWACTRLLSETVASLPLSFYRLVDDLRVPAPEHPIARLFAGKVNRYQTRVEFFETLMLNLVMTGNAFMRIQRLASGDIVSLLPMMSSQIEVQLLDDGSVTYSYYHDGSIDVYAQASVWHVKLFGNGVIGLSPLSYARNILGITQAAESAVTKIYANGAKPSGVLSFDRLLTPEQRAQVRNNFNGLTTGTGERLLVTEMGSKFDAISMSPQDIELLASRRFQIEEICRLYGVPSVLVNDTSGSTTWGTGIQQIVEGFYKLNLRPYLERLEQSIVTYLCSDPAGSIQAEFDFEALLRSDMQSRFNGYKTGILSGFMKPNEARAMEGMQPVDGGDELLAPVNTLPIDKLGANVEAQNGA